MVGPEKKAVERLGSRRRNYVDYKTSKSTKSFVEQPFHDIILYYDRYVQYFKAMKYNLEVTGRLDDVSLWNQWYAMNIWEAFINKDDKRKPDDFENMPPKLRQNLLDVGELLLVKEAFLNQVRVTSRGVVNPVGAPIQ